MKLTEQLNELNESAELVNEKEHASPLVTFSQYWILIRACLMFAKIFTGSKADIKINSVIAWGNIIYQANNINN